MPLAEYASTTGSFGSVARVLLSKIDSTEKKMSYKYDTYLLSVFHII